MSTFTGAEARALLDTARTASLGTISRHGGIPYVSLVNAGSDAAGRPVVLTSRLSWHTQNLIADPRGSYMVADPPAAGDALTGPRVTVLGRFEPCDDPEIKRRYGERHPDARMYMDFADFGFWRLMPDLIHAIAGFGRIDTLQPDEVFPPG